MRKFWLLFFLTFAVLYFPRHFNVSAQQIGFSSPPGVRVQDEGALQGRATTVNFTGAGVTATVSAGAATVNVPGGGAGASWTTVEIDFGTAARFVKTMTVTDAGVSATSKIMALQSGTAATGRQADENEMDSIACRATPGTGDFRLICSNGRTVTHGLFKINYTVN